jgi:hypothetical protein
MECKEKLGMKHGIRGPTGALAKDERMRVAAGVAATLAAYFVFIWACLASHRMDPSYFVCAGDRFVDVAALPGPMIVNAYSDGYDGEFYYRMALRPFSVKRVEIGICIDDVVYRAHRIGYPLLAWLGSWGSPRRAQWMMVFINWAALGALAGVGMAFVRRLGSSPWWGLVFAFSPAMILSLNRDLTDVLGAAFLASGLLSLRRGKTPWAVMFLTMAGLTRETTLVACAAIFLAWAWSWTRRDRRDAAPWVAWAIPIGVYLAWLSSVCLRCHEAPFAGSGRVFSFPLVAAVKYGVSLLSLSELRSNFLLLLGFFYYLAFGLAVALAFFRSRANAHEKIALLLYSLVPICANKDIWTGDYWAYMRCLGDFHLMGAIVLLGSKSRARWPIFGLMVVIWLFLFVVCANLHPMRFLGRVL